MALFFHAVHRSTSDKPNNVGLCITRRQAAYPYAALCMTPTTINICVSNPQLLRPTFCSGCGASLGGRSLYMIDNVSCIYETSLYSVMGRERASEKYR